MCMLLWHISNIYNNNEIEILRWYINWILVNCLFLHAYIKYKYKDSFISVSHFGIITLIWLEELHFTKY